jgi:hypothetical protein
MAGHQVTHVAVILNKKNAGFHGKTGLAVGRRMERASLNAYFAVIVGIWGRSERFRCESLPQLHKLVR